MKKDIKLWESIYYRLEFVKDIEMRVYITEIIYRIRKWL